MIVIVKILVLEDDVKLNQIVCMKLNTNGFHTISCQNAISAFDNMASTTVDLIISDIMMPGIDGFEFAEFVRKQDKEVPILFVTAKDDFSSKEKGYRIGIDDYLVKPIDLDEMLLHVNALLRRANIASEKKLVIGNFTMDVEERVSYLNDEEIPLTVKEFQVLFKLLSYPKRTFTRTQLMDEFWGVDSETSSRTLDVHISHLRDKLTECKEFELISIRGIGYKAVLKHE